MKKLISFILLLFVPFIVNAQDVEITNIELLEKTGNVVINNEPTYEGLNINFDLEFTDVEDSVKYKVTVINNSDEEYLIDDDIKYGDGEYIKYELSMDNNIIKGKETKLITITVSYDKEIPNEVFDNGVYDTKESITISLSNDEKNPNTSTLPMIAIILAITAIIATILLKLNHKKAAITTMALTIIAIPVVSIAINKVSFNIQSRIFIKDRCYVLDTTIGSFEQGKETKSICVSFAENKYYVEEFYSAQWYVKKLETDDLVLNVRNYYMNEDSYVRVYQGETLIKEVTLADFPKKLLHVSDAYYFGDYTLSKSLGNELTREDVTVEVSEDLEDYEDFEVFFLMYSGSKGTQTIKGPWMAKQEEIEKVFYLQTFNTEDLVLKGFQRDRKDSHLYHAIWEKPDIIV